MKKKQIKKILLFILMIGVIGVVLTGYTKLYNSKIVNTNASTNRTEVFSENLLAAVDGKHTYYECYRDTCELLYYDIKTIDGVVEKLKLQESKNWSANKGETWYDCDKQFTATNAQKQGSLDGGNCWDGPNIFTSKYTYKNAQKFCNDEYDLQYGTPYDELFYSPTNIVDSTRTKSNNYTKTTCEKKENKCYEIVDTNACSAAGCKVSNGNCIDPDPVNNDSSTTDWISVNKETTVNSELTLTSDTDWCSFKEEEQSVKSGVYSSATLKSSGHSCIFIATKAGTYYAYDKSKSKSYKYTISVTDNKIAYLTLNPNGGSLVSTDPTYSDLNGRTTTWSTAYITTPGEPKEFNLSDVTAKRTGYTFNGWGNSAGCTSGSLSTVSITTDVTYYACWKSTGNTGNTGNTGETAIHVPIAETIKTDFYDDPIRYVGGTGTEASASYQKVSCGDEVYITTCDDNRSDTATCNVTSINGIKVTGTKVYRQKLMETKPTCPIVRYARSGATYYTSASNVTSKTNPKELGCNAKLDFVKQPAVACTYGEIIDDSQQFCEVSYKGETIYVDRMQIGISEAICIEDECTPSTPLKDQKSYEEKTMSVCYEYDGKGKFEVNGADEKEIFKCASGYRRVIKPDSENDTCKDLTDNDEAQSCYRTYTYTCNSVDRPKVYGTGSLVTPDNVGTISIKGTDSATKTGLKGYIINLGESVTRDSDWKEFENSEYIASVPRHAGTHFAWVMTNDRSISYPIMLRIHSDDLTTTAEVGLKGPNDDLTNSLKPIKSEDGLAYLDGVTSQEYVRLSNQLMNDSIIAAGFDLFTTAYELTVDSATVALYATLTSSDSKYVEGYEPRTIDLDYGRNVAIIKIENSKGAQRSYTFVINRTDTRESVNALTDVTLSVGTINFDPYVSDYTVSVPKNTKSVNINGTLESDKSAFIVGYEPRTIDLTEDVTSAVLKTISEAGITRNYVFTFIKTGAEVSSSISNSTYLSSITIPGTEISFDKENLSYSVSIEYEIESVAVYALPESANATVEVYGSQGLKVGANKVEIVVTNGEATKIYNVFINRKEDGLGVSSNTKLKTLTVKDYDIKFSPDVEDYIIKIKREKTLLLTATPESDRSEVYMYGNNDLTAFSTVRVKVIAENGDTGLYSVDIIKDVYNKKLETTIAIVGSIIILGSGIIIMVGKRRKKLQDYMEE